MRKWLIAAIVGALTLLGFGFVGGSALASIPDASGTIHGCYKPSGYAQGSLMVIDSDAGQSCPSDTTALNWNQAGPAGVSGYQVVSCSTQSASPTCSQGGGGYEVTCPPGKVAISAGYQNEPVNSEGTQLTDMYPTTDGASYVFKGGTMPAWLYATCVNAS